MEIEYIETERELEIVPEFLMEKNLIEKVGEKPILKWFLVEATKQEFEEQEGESYQEIYIKNNREFSEKLNETFFYSVANEFRFNHEIGKNYFLVFKLNPTEILEQESRLSWWDENIVCAEFENGNWIISNVKVWLLNEIYGNILKCGQVKIKNGL